ncbi:MAG: Arginyl-tRNA--protein transferase 1 [Thelocarpon impressellum]|nr:MAG: Arginyl-tRNA--protein transferase 1 [Thelocarpon impressellum]
MQATAAAAPADDPSVSFLTPLGLRLSWTKKRRRLPQSLVWLLQERKRQQSGPIPITSQAYYATSRSLSAPLYQALLDRGWRRSGTQFYKPHVRLACCPHYTIRLDSAASKPSKDQRQALHRWSRYVLGDGYIRESARLHPKTKQEKAQLKNGFNLLDSVHGCEADSLKRPPRPDHDFVVTLEHDEFTEEKYALFSDYQRNVHKEPPSRISRVGFERFLCSSPLQRSSRRLSSGQEQVLGSYHQCYRLDGQLIAMGFLDLLPQCVSSVYFMAGAWSYRDNFKQWNFGKLGAMRETALSMEAGYKYYYMGMHYLMSFYIPSCVKMRYKGDYSPQYLLDPESYGWDLLDDDLRRALDVRKYISVSREYRLGRDPRQTARGLVEQQQSGLSAGASDPSTTGDSGAAMSAGQKSGEVGKDEDADDDNDEDAVDDDVEDEDDDDEDEDGSIISVFNVDMPGVMTPQEVEDKIDLDGAPINLGGRKARAMDLVTWQRGKLDDPTTVKGALGELAATVGPEICRELVFSFS